MGWKRQWAYIHTGYQLALFYVQSLSRSRFFFSSEEKKEKRNRHLLDFNSSPAGELETTKMPSYYMDEDYPVRPLSK